MMLTPGTTILRRLEQRDRIHVLLSEIEHLLSNAHLLQAERVAAVLLDLEREYTLGRNNSYSRSIEGLTNSHSQDILVAIRRAHARLAPGSAIMAVREHPTGEWFG